MSLRALIVDDEALARTRMNRLLSGDPEIEISGECRNSREAYAFLSSQTVDVVFLDIQMPGENGFDLIEKIGFRKMPVTVFVTAHNHYAIRAFEVHALDYLTKPIEQERLASTIEHVKQRVRERTGEHPSVSYRGDLEETLRSMLASLGPSSQTVSYTKRLLVPDGAKTTFIDVETIEWIEAADYYVRIHSGQKEFLLRESMKDLAAALDPSRFVRIHRSAIVNLACVREVFREGRGDGTVVLSGGRRLPMSSVGWKALLASGRS
ncbi:response regulator transcription factor [Terriglobus albidus]|uniref:Response regulator transcription factor n=1 Tax=Terriglobus albidus TaxID=1592106 RepID=A0A5B9E4Z6_9BACT|nr:LytTR family DNA-binding domain-containing protein [Terriglobus albidus]QEE27058.1 response regulator transcription factor [Terriglobus albidus]